MKLTAKTIKAMGIDFTDAFWKGCGRPIEERREGRRSEALVEAEAYCKHCGASNYRGHGAG